MPLMLFIVLMSAAGILNKKKSKAVFVSPASFAISHECRGDELFDEPVVEVKRSLPHSFPQTLGWKSADFEATARSHIAWRHLPKDTWSKFNFPHYSPDQKLQSFPIFNFAPPLAAKICSLTKYGGSDDGGKFLCSLDQLQEGCVIYSLGSNNNFQFEMSMLRETPCSIHTFDCTVDGFNKPADPRVVFHRQCLGNRVAIGESMRLLGRSFDSSLFFSLAELAFQNGHDAITILKMDIENGEYSVFESLSDDVAIHKHLLPDQISFELHVSERDPLGFPEGICAVCNVWTLWSNVLDLGYAIVSREDNPLCPHCAEYTLVRAFQPSPIKSLPPCAPSAALVDPWLEGTRAATFSRIW